MGEFTGCTELLGVEDLAGSGGLLGLVGPGTAGDCGGFCRGADAGTVSCWSAAAFRPFCGEPASGAAGVVPAETFLGSVCRTETEAPAPRSTSRRFSSVSSCERTM